MKHVLFVAHSVWAVCVAVLVVVLAEAVWQMTAVRPPEHPDPQRDGLLLWLLLPPAAISGVLLPMLWSETGAAHRAVLALTMGCVGSAALAILWAAESSGSAKVEESALAGGCF